MCSEYSWRKMGSYILLLISFLLVASCNQRESDNITIVNLNKNLEVITNRVRRLTLTGDLVKKKGTIEKVKISQIKIDWGDGVTSNFESRKGLNSIAKSHKYYSAGTYPIEVTVKDKMGRKTSKTIILIIDTAQEAQRQNFNLVYVPAGVHNYTEKSKPRTIAVYYDYYIGQYEVTTDQFVEFLNDRPVSADGKLQEIELIDMEASGVPIGHDGEGFFVKDGKSKQPVREVTWYGAVSYCNWLSERQGLAKAYNEQTKKLVTKYVSTLEGYRLPTVNEWEYAARGGKQGRDTIYAGSNKIDEVAWYREHNSDSYPFHQVGKKKPNELGIYDLTGNVWEWTYHSHFLTHHQRQALRNGFLEFDPRATAPPTASKELYGLRVVRTVK